MDIGKFEEKYHRCLRTDLKGSRSTAEIMCKKALREYNETWTTNELYEVLKMGFRMGKGTSYTYTRGERSGVTVTMGECFIRMKNDFWKRVEGERVYDRKESGLNFKKIGY